ncbi:hypothetical protein ACFE04_030615 [Oxalis oulophora]
MLKFSHSGILTDQLQCSLLFSSQTRRLDNHTLLAPANAAVVGVNRNGKSTRMSLKVVSPDLHSVESQEETSLASRLRLGNMAEDGASYMEKFVIRSYEVGINKTATVETMANLLQEVACNHVQSLGFSADGFGTTFTMRKLNLIWVTARMHIEIYKYPAWSDVVEIETWFHSEGKFASRRDWVLRDYTNGQVIGRATSKWVMMNTNTRRLERVTPAILEEYSGYSPKELRSVFREKNSTSSKKILKLEDPVQHSRLRLAPRAADLDMNQHVNNVTYIGWVLEVNYRRECQRDDIIDSLTSIEPTEETEVVSELQGTNGSAVAPQIDENRLKFLHLIRLSSDSSEINRARTEWRKKPQT